MNVSTLLLFNTLLINTVLYGLSFKYVITIYCVSWRDSQHSNGSFIVSTGRGVLDNIFKF